MPSVAQAQTLRLPLVCRLTTVGAGQFHGLEFAAGPTGGGITVTIAASALDLRLGRAALVQDDRADVMDLNTGERDAVLIGHDDASTIVLSLFTAAAKGATIPAALSRQSLIGSIPVVVQSTGTCAAPP